MDSQGKSVGLNFNNQLLESFAGRVDTTKLPQMLKPFLYILPPPLFLTTSQLWLFFKTWFINKLLLLLSSFRSCWTTARRLCVRACVPACVCPENVKPWLKRRENCSRFLDKQDKLQRPVVRARDKASPQGAWIRDRIVTLVQNSCSVSQFFFYLPIYIY